MKTLLHIDASPRLVRSHSRKLAAKFAAEWRAAQPGARVIVHDLVKNPPPFVSEDWVAAAYNPPHQHSAAEKAAIAVSDHYIDELLSADEIVISTPIYNLSIPAVLKAWIDQIVRFGRTFNKGPAGFEGLVKGKKATVIVASGSDFRPGTPGGAYNHLEPYLRAVFGFIGITDVRFVYAYAMNDESAHRDQILSEAATALHALAAT